MRTKLNIGLFGFGVVGTGLYEVLNRSTLLDAEIRKIVVKDQQKERKCDPAFISFAPDDILQDAQINVVVELINDSEAAYHIIKSALQAKKHVVSANKKVIAYHLQEFIQLARANEVSFLYEAAVGGSIPILRNLEEYYNNDSLSSIEGIVNGTSNFILSQSNGGKTFDEALSLAQELGFAETDPSSDVDGFDSKFKLKILLKHGFGADYHPDHLFNCGIRRLKPQDIAYAGEKGYRIKLFSRAEKIGGEIVAFVAPHFVPDHHFAYQVNNEFNAVVLEGLFSDKQLFIGKGAGSYPTASAVLSDISALQYAYTYEYKKESDQLGLQPNNNFFVRVYLGSPFIELINEVPFYRVDEVFQSNAYCFQTGWVRFSEISSINFNKKRDLSLIILPDALKSQEDFAKIEAERKFAVTY